MITDEHGRIIINLVSSPLSKSHDTVENTKISTPEFKSFLDRFSINADPQSNQAQQTTNAHEECEIIKSKDIESIEATANIGASPDVLIRIDSMLMDRLEIDTDESVVISSQPISNLITFQKNFGDFEHGSILDFSCLVFTAEELHSNLFQKSKDSMKNWLKALTSPLKPRFQNISLIVIGLDSLASKFQANTNKEFKKCLAEGKKMKLTPTKTSKNFARFENEFFLCCTHIGINIQNLSRKDDLLRFVRLFAKVLAKDGDSHNEDSRIIPTFHLSNNSKKGIHTDFDCWKSMLEEILRITPRISETIVRAYPTLNSLLLRYRSLPTNDGRLLLSDLEVVGGKKIGDSISSRIYEILWAKDGGKPAYLQ